MPLMLGSSSWAPPITNRFRTSARGSESEVCGIRYETCAASSKIQASRSSAKDCEPPSSEARSSIDRIEKYARSADESLPSIERRTYDAHVVLELGCCGHLV